VEQVTLQVSVKTLILNSENQALLLEKNTNINKVYSDTRDIPGGRINPGFTLFENLDQELEEEIYANLADFSEPILITTQDIQNPTFHVLRLTHILRCSPEIQISDELESFQWVNLADLKEMKGLNSFLPVVLQSDYCIDLVLPSKGVQV